MNNEFHQPFIKSLLLIASITLVAIVGTQMIADYYSESHINPVIFTSSSPASQDK